MSDRPDPFGRRSWTTWLATLAAIASVGLAGWQMTESRRNDRIEREAARITQERNEQQQNICSAVNALNDALVTILRTVAEDVEPGESPVERALRFRRFIDEVHEARCVTQPLRSIS